MKRRRVVAYVTRDRDSRRELLVFDDPKHPHMGVQVPAGRLDSGEALEAGLLRELKEETGLTSARIVRELPGFEEHYPSRYENHGFHYRWAAIETDLHLFGRPHPLLAHLGLPI